jgi:hypothetical protein
MLYRQHHGSVNESTSEKSVVDHCGSWSENARNFERRISSPFDLTYVMVIDLLADARAEQN